MPVEFQLLDVDYVFVDNKPHIRLFGKTSDKKSITVFFDEFYPYFYVMPSEEKEEQLKKYLSEKYNTFIVNVESVDKFLSIGYNEKPVNLLKITLTNPAMVPTIRDDLKTKPFVKETFEADILFKYRFMADNHINGMSWYSVDGDGIKTNTVKTEKIIKSKSIKPITKEENVPFKYVSLDIETYSEEGGMPDSTKDPIIMLSMFFYPAYKGKNSIVLVAKKVKNYIDDIQSFQNEKEMLEEFKKIIDEYDPDIILGYNSSNFDFPYLEARLRANNIPRTLGRCLQKPMMCSKFTNRYTVTIPGRIVVDVYSLIKEATTKFGLYKGLKRFGLGDVSQLILGESKVDVSHSEINSHWKDDGEKFKKLVDYSRKDAELPFRMLFEMNMLDKFIEISKVSGLVLQDVLDGGEAARIENLLLKEFNKRGFVIPNKPTNEELGRRNEERIKHSLKGGFVLDPVIGFHDKSVVYLDFKSMYPSIMIAINICPTTLLLDQNTNIDKTTTSYGTSFVKPTVRKGIIPDIVEYLITTRDKIKKEMKTAKTQEVKRRLYAKQYAFKTVANAFYGYTGYIRARLYVLEIANTITSTGRDAINNTKNIVEKNTPYKVIYADTDSVMVKLKTTDVKEAFEIGEQLAELINSNLEYSLKMKIEGVFRTLLILNKKRYAGWSFEPVGDGFEESIVTKGIETIRRDWCNLVSETLQDVLNIILKEQDIKKALNLVKVKINDIKTGKMDINKLVITKSISKSLKTYKGVQPHVELLKKMRKRDPASAPGIGDRIGFVIVKGTGMVSKRTEDPEYVIKHKLSIDSRYYIESQLLPPLERVFEALNISKLELLGIGKQVGLLDLMRNGKEEKVFEDYLSKIDGMICNECNNIFRRVPLTGKCDSCNGEIVFYFEGKRSKIFDPTHVTR